MFTHEAIEAFLDSRKARGLEQSSIEWYRIILEYYSAMYPGELPLNPEAIEHFLASCRGKDERRHGFFRALKCFYRFVHRRYDLPNPIEKLDPPIKKRKLPKALMPEDFVRLMEYPHKPHIRAYLTFLADSGCRLSELKNLKAEDLLMTNWGNVAKINGKTGQRYVPIMETTYSMIVEYLPITYHVDWLGHLIIQAFRDAGIKGSPHVIRHTFASTWMGSETALQQILGHSNFNTTRLYRNLRTQILSTQHKEFSPLLLVQKTS